jgi:hypothetical protein
VRVGGVLGVEGVATFPGGDVEDLVGRDEQDLRVRVRTGSTVQVRLDAAFTVLGVAPGGQDGDDDG